MNFSQFSPALIGGGVAVIALTLFLLQRLRVRFQQVDIVTTLFWRQAQEENRTRVLTQRFRHPWVYLFLLTIASLLWFAAAGLDFGGEGERDYVLVLDGSLAMTEAETWQQAVDAIEADAAALPARQREVWLAQSPPLLLLQQGEHERLLQERLANRSAREQKNALTALLLRFGTDPQRRTPTQVRVFGHARLAEGAAALLPSDLEVVYRSPWLHLPQNRGLLSAGWREAASGNWDCVDFAATISGPINPWQLLRNGQIVQQLPQAIANQDGSSTLWFPDLSADGSELEMQLLGEDGLAADNQYRCTLPVRKSIAVHVAADLPDRVATLVDADPSLTRVAANVADVVIRGNGSPITTLPQLVFSDADSSHAFQVQSASYANAEELLNAAIPALGIHQIDGLALAESLQREVSLGASADGERGIQLWQALLDPEHGFVHSQSFPQFLSKSVRWLAAAEGSDDPTSLTGNSRATLASDVAQLDPVATLRLAQAAPTAEEPDPLSEDRGWPLWNWLILLVFALLLLEWAWYQQGRLP